MINQVLQIIDSFINKEIEKVRKIICRRPSAMIPHQFYQFIKDYRTDCMKDVISDLEKYKQRILQKCTDPQGQVLISAALRADLITPLVTLIERQQALIKSQSQDNKSEACAM